MSPAPPGTVPAPAAARPHMAPSPHCPLPGVGLVTVLYPGHARHAPDSGPLQSLLLPLGGARPPRSESSALPALRSLRRLGSPTGLGWLSGPVPTAGHSLCPSPALLLSTAPGPACLVRIYLLICVLPASYFENITSVCHHFPNA